MSSPPVSTSSSNGCTLGGLPKETRIDDASNYGEDDEDEVGPDKIENENQKEDQDEVESNDEDNFCEYGDGGQCLECHGCTETYVTSLIKAYTLGDRFLAPLYKRVVLDQLIETTRDYIQPKWFRGIAYAYNNSNFATKNSSDDWWTKPLDPCDYPGYAVTEEREECSKKKK